MEVRKYHQQSFLYFKTNFYEYDLFSILKVDDIFVPRLPLNTESYKFHDWDMVYFKSHILKSVCINNNECVKDDPNCCELCV